MAINTYAKSVQLLERIANSVHERDPKIFHQLFFNMSEVLLVQEWIHELIKEVEEE